MVRTTFDWFVAKSYNLVFVCNHMRFKRDGDMLIELSNIEFRKRELD